MQMKYYVGNQAEQFAFIRIPRELVVGEAYASLSTQSKIMYGMLLDRLGMSYKNRWLDEENRVYIVYSLEDIQADMNDSVQQQWTVFFICVAVGIFLNVLCWMQKSENRSKATYAAESDM